MEYVDSDLIFRMSSTFNKFHKRKLTQSNVMNFRGLILFCLFALVCLFVCLFIFALY